MKKNLLFFYLHAKFQQDWFCRRGAMAVKSLSVTGCVSTQRYKHDSNVGFANRDFTPLFLKKFEAQSRLEPFPRYPVNLASLNLKSTPLPTTPLGQSLRSVEFWWPYSTTTDQLMGVQFCNGYLI